MIYDTNKLTTLARVQFCDYSFKDGEVRISLFVGYLECGACLLHTLCKYRDSNCTLMLVYVDNVVAFPTSSLRTFSNIMAKEPCYEYPFFCVDAGLCDVRCADE
jgi:hypothetical protein